jgi:quinol---cytochrome c reductase iron-sulfur subunit, bacillus type
MLRPEFHHRQGHFPHSLSGDSRVVPRLNPATHNGLISEFSRRTHNCLSAWCSRSTSSPHVIRSLMSETLIEDVGGVETPVGRRTFLRRISGACATIVAAIVGIPALRALFTPAVAKSAVNTWTKVADDTALLDIGTPIRVDFVQNQSDAWVETRAMNSVWLFTEDGDKFKAYNGHCTHLGCGFIYDKERKTFICPCHRGQFDVKTGAVLAGPPPRPLDELEVQVKDSAVFVKYRDFRLGVAERVEV